MMFYEIMFNQLGKRDYKKAYRDSVGKYEAFFPSRDVFSMNRVEAIDICPRV